MSPCLMRRWNKAYYRLCRLHNLPTNGDECLWLMRARGTSGHMGRAARQMQRLGRISEKKEPRDGKA